MQNLKIRTPYFGTLIFIIVHAQVDFYPVYDARGLLERSEPVPFRLTRNLHTFFTPFGVEGVFVSAMAAAAQVAPETLTQNPLSRSHVP